MALQVVYIIGLLDWEQRMMHSADTAHEKDNRPIESIKNHDNVMLQRI